MIQQHLIEKISRAHPSRGEREIRDDLNRIKRSFCKETKIIEGEFTTFNTDGTSLYFDLGNEVSEVKQVDLAGTPLAKLSGVHNIPIQS